MGFIPDIERICKMVPFTRQTLFFTATMPPEIQRITEQFLHNPVRVEVSRPASTAETVIQGLVKTGREPHEKRETLRALIRSAEGLKNAIIFCNRKREVAMLHRSLVRHKFSAVALHGDMDQPARMAALEQFRRGEVSLLVASDVAARGLDIPDVSHVYNFDVPHHPDDYVHRVGRTGRAGRSGVALTIVAPADTKAVSAIEKLTGQTIAWVGSPPVANDDDGAEEHTRRSGERSRGGRRPARPRGNAAPQDEARAPASRTRPERGHRPDRGPRPERGPRPVAAERAVAAREDHRPSRPERRPEPVEEADLSHLPAFLLRPVRVKA
jgi:superfamily II DNA/RNA helicase